jgi:hypothetical protein
VPGEPLPQDPNERAAVHDDHDEDI